MRLFVQPFLPASRRPRIGAKSRWVLLMAVALLALASCARRSVQPGSPGSPGWLGVDIVGMIASSDPIGKTCLTITAFFSIASWAIIIYKFLHVQAASRQTNRFVRECMAGSGSLEDAYRNAAAYPDSPLAQILREGYLELEIEDWYKQGYNLSSDQRIEVAKAGIERVFERTIANEISHLESYVIFLALTSNVCPFVGLFGTVWGIMATFQSMAFEGSGTLSVLAPGIATALTTTVAGLAAAIPASVAYNYFTGRVQVLISRMDAFALELSNIIQKQLLKREV
ncbi:MotA/TolQ/ExbB proton channel family protein [Candidatus Sumerlaeota bacterium]|nr:MotA/TolQ/ExbB proton channel family protein [Candidatus Sumerlaeota bacterium]